MVSTSFQFWFMKSMSPYWKSKCKLTDQLPFSGVGKCPFLGILNITFTYLLDITSPIAGWCETLGHLPTPVFEWFSEKIGWRNFRTAEPTFFQAPGGSRPFGRSKLHLGHACISQVQGQSFYEFCWCASAVMAWNDQNTHWALWGLVLPPQPHWATCTRMMLFFYAPWCGLHCICFVSAAFRVK